MTVKLWGKPEKADEWRAKRAQSEAVEKWHVTTLTIPIFWPGKHRNFLTARVNEILHRP